MSRQKFRESSVLDVPAQDLLHRFAIFEKEQDWSKSIAVFSKGSALNDKSLCKKEGSTVSLWDVSDEAKALPLLTSDPLKDPVTDYLGVAGTTSSSYILCLSHGCS